MRDEGALGGDLWWSWWMSWGLSGVLRMGYPPGSLQAKETYLGSLDELIESLLMAPGAGEKEGKGRNS